VPFGKLLSHHGLYTSSPFWYQYLPDRKLVYDGDFS
jgi:hypothetical protein